MTSTVSVVVIGRNEGSRLSRCFDSISGMEHPFEQLIYVDSASTDDSVARAKQAGAQVITLAANTTTAARGRNAGWQAATSDYVLFLDGDTVLEPQFVTHALEVFQDPKVAAVWGHRRELHPDVSVYNRVLDLDWVYRPGISDFCGGDAVIRRSVLEQLKGYDEHLVAGEEPEMCGRMQALGFTILHIDRPMTGHDLDMHHFGQYWKRAVRAGFAYAAVSQRFRKTERRLWDRDSKRNLIHATALLALPLCASTLAFTTHSALPLLVLGLMLLLLLTRTAYRSAWKSPGQPLTLFLYALHSHIEQIPISVGQIQFFLLADKRHRLIEYKGAAS